jgi:hypothetical protein
MAIVAALLVSGVWAIEPSESDRARAAWLQAYGQRKAGEKAQTAGNNAAALARFREAERLLLQVQERYPRWSASMIAMRLSQCREQIASLAPAPAGAGQPVATAQPGQETVQPAASQPITIGVDSAAVAALRAEIRRLQQAAAAADTRAATADQARANAETVMVENQQLQARLASVERSLAAAATELRTLKQRQGITAATAAAADARKALDAQRAIAEQDARKLALRSAAAVREAKRLGFDLQAANNAIDEQRALAEIAAAKIAGLGGALEKAAAARDQLLTENKQLTHEVDTLQHALAAAKAAAKGHSRSLAKAREDAKAMATMPPLKKQVAALQDQLARTEAEVDDAQRALAAAAKREKALADKHAALLKAAAGLERQIVELGNGGASKATEDLAARLAELRVDADTAPLRKKLAGLERELAAARRVAEASNTRMTGLEAAAQGARTDAVTAAAEKDVLAAQLEVARATAKALEDAVHDAREHAQDQDKTITRLQAEQHSQRQRTAKGRADLDRLQQANAGVREKNRQLQVRLAERDAELTDVRLQIVEAQAAADRQRAAADDLRRRHTAQVTLLEALGGAAGAAAQPQAAVATPPAAPAAVLATDDAPAARQATRQQQTAALLQQATAAERAGDRKRAAWCYHRALEIDADTAPALIRLGQLAVDDGDFARGAGLLSRASYLRPDDLDVLGPLGLPRWRSPCSAALSPSRLRMPTATGIWASPAGH